VALHFWEGGHVYKSAAAVWRGEKCPRASSGRMLGIVKIRVKTTKMMRRMMMTRMMKGMGNDGKP
jgi:hypothetical protein